MKALRGIAVAAALLLTGGPAGLAQRNDWVAYRSAEHGFEASFPVAPKVDLLRMSPEAPITLVKVEAVNKSGQPFQVIVYEYGTSVPPPGAAPEDLEKTLEVYGAGSGTKPRDKHMTKIDGHPAIEAAMDAPSRNEYELIDITVVERRMFMIMSSGRKGHETSPAALRFRDSFRTLEGERL